MGRGDDGQGGGGSLSERESMGPCCVRGRGGTGQALAGGRRGRERLARTFTEREVNSQSGTGGPVPGGPAGGGWVGGCWGGGERRWRRRGGPGGEWGERFGKRRGRDRGWGNALMFESRCCPGRSAVRVALLSDSLYCLTPGVSKRGRGIQAGWAGS